jgi:hypothetical protein
MRIARVTAVRPIGGWTSRRILVDRTSPRCPQPGQEFSPSVIRHSTVRCRPVWCCPIAVSPRLGRQSVVSRQGGVKLCTRDLGSWWSLEHLHHCTQGPVVIDARLSSSHRPIYEEPRICRHPDQCTSRYPSSSKRGWSSTHRRSETVNSRFDANSSAIRSASILPS